MRRADLGRVIRPAMVAFGEDRDGVHMRVFQGRNEVGRVKVPADIGNVLGCVEVEVDLAITQRLVSSGDHSLAPVWVGDPSAN